MVDAHPLNTLRLAIAREREAWALVSSSPVSGGTFPMEHWRRWRHACAQADAAQWQAFQATIASSRAALNAAPDASRPVRQRLQPGC